MTKYLIIFLTVISFSITAQAHPGSTDSSGCHTCRTNCSSWGLSTGEYHCHNAKQPTQPLEPITSHYGEGGTGYTTPEPDYKYENNEAAREKMKTVPSQQLNSQTKSSDNNNSSNGAWVIIITLGIVGIIGYNIYKKHK